MMKNFFCVALVVCTSVVSACQTNLPYSPSIVGRTYSMRQSCGPARFVAHSRVSVSDTEISYMPFYEDFNHGGVNPGYVCPQTYIFRIQKWAPLLIELPRLVAPANSGPLDEYCQREQQRQKVQLQPQGSTRAQFISGVKATVEGITFLRDHECRAEPHIPFTYSEEYLNGWLDGPITYLRGVAFNFDICLD
eukprot:gb/GEZJ01003454.1/.p1 GENE.gb/GEZJ01003454.1/~~gb/GEZJ01003454.1/.p1  ORF type:complete len:192 (-),score=10.45 gb/GEZJ01003454.1/:589-1164(-)